MSASMWACFLDHLEHFKLLNNLDGGEDTSMESSLLRNEEKRETDNDGRTWVHWSVRKTEPLKCLKVREENKIRRRRRKI